MNLRRIGVLTILVVMKLPVFSQQAIITGSLTSSAGGSFTEGSLRVISVVGQATPLGVGTSTAGDLILSPGFVSFWRSATTSPLSAPQLNPLPGDSLNQDIAPTFSWNSAVGASSYRLQISYGSVFDLTKVVYTDTTRNTQLSARDLAYNTQYFWRVKSIDAGGTEGPASEARTFWTKAQVATLTTAQFNPAPNSSTQYLMVSFPGTGDVRVSDFVNDAGSQKGIDWRVLLDNGSSTNYLTELDASSTVPSGQGCWLLRKNPLSLSRQTTMPNLDAQGNDSIHLHQGWNIIGNRFTRSVFWASVISANGLLSTNPSAYAYIRGWDSLVTKLEPSQGYYFLNSTGKQWLRIPYPFPGQAVESVSMPRITWQLQLEVKSDINQDRYNFVGIAPSARPDQDALDSYKPPLVFDQTFLYFNRPEWDSMFSNFSTDYRDEIGKGQAWDFEVSNPRLSQTRITVEGIENVPTENGLVLMNLSNTASTNLRSKNEVTFQPAGKVTKFRLLVGGEEFIKEQMQQNIPTAFSLEQNYPNPFNPSTTIRYSLPNRTHVALTIFNVLGQEVAQIVDGEIEAGYHEVQFSPSRLASGVYIFRLQAGTFLEVKKMQLLK